MEKIYGLTMRWIFCKLIDELTETGERETGDRKNKVIGTKGK